MNRFILVAFSVLSLLSSACKKDKQNSKDPGTYLTADKDNKSWVSTGHSFAEVGGAKNFHLGGHKGEEHLLIQMTTNSLNEYVLVNDKTEFHVTVGYDAVMARYILDEGATNTINVTNYDTKQVIMEGKFKFTFKKLTGPDSYPATVTFTNGKFRLSKAYD